MFVSSRVNFHQFLRSQPIHVKKCVALINSLSWTFISCNLRLAITLLSLISLSESDHSGSYPSYFSFDVAVGRRFVAVDSFIA